jgi:hypothetical protein
MDTSNELDSSYKILTKNVLASRAIERVQNMLMASSAFKQPRMTTIAKYQKLYDGKVDKKLRQLFNIALPVFSGLIDTLNAQYDTPIQLQFSEGEAADYFKAKKINAMWQKEYTSTAQNTIWDAKLRLARQQAIMTGRGILKYTAESDPEYKSSLDVVNFKNFHFQPRGGLWLENHLFAGEEGIKKTIGDLKRGAEAGVYDRSKSQRLLSAWARRTICLSLILRSDYRGSPLLALTPITIRMLAKQYFCSRNLFLKWTVRDGISALNHGRRRGCDSRSGRIWIHRSYTRGRHGRRMRTTRISRVNLSAMTSIP